MQEEIRAGYKQTEVGVIPEDWDVLPLGRLFDVQLGKMLDEEKNVGVLKPYLGNRSVQWGRIDTSELAEMRMTQRDLVRFRLREGDILVCEGGEVGRSAMWQSEVAECYYQKALHRLRPTTPFDSRLLLSLLKSFAERNLFSNYVTQTSIAHLPKEKFVEIPIPVPPIPEQRAIAAALADADGLIAALEGMIAKKRDLKQAAMQHLLTGKTRLPGFSGEWELKRLGDLLEYEQPTKYLVSSTDYDDSYDIPVLTAGKSFLLGHTNESHGVFTQLPVIIFDDFTTATQFVDFPFKAKSSAMKLLKPRNPQVNLRLVYDMMQTIEFVMSDHKRYWISEYQKIEVPFPDPAEQAAIAEILSDMDADLAALEAQADKARAVKQGMTQELLTGRVRLV